MNSRAPLPLVLTFVLQLLPVQRSGGFPLLPQLVHGQQVHNVVFEKLQTRHSRLFSWRMKQTNFCITLSTKGRGRGGFTLLKSLMGSYPEERAHALVETLLMSPSFSEAEARAAASSGFPVKQTISKH